MGLRQLTTKSGKPLHANWGFCAGSTPAIDPEWDEDWIGAHPGNLLAKPVPLSEQERQERVRKYRNRLRRRWSTYYRTDHWRETKKIKLIKLGRYKFTARETSLYAKQYEYDHHMHEYRYPYMQHVMDYYGHRIKVREDLKTLTLREEGRRRAQYLQYLVTAPDDHLNYDQWCIRGLLSP